MCLRSAALLALLLLMLSSCVAQRSVMPAALVPPPSMREGLVAMFADCASAVGPTRELPLVEGGSTTFEDLGVLIPLSDPGLVSDGYYHWLRVQHATGLIYIVQVGGIAGWQTLFGPFTAEAGCLAYPRKESPPLLRELARISTGCLTGRLSGPA